MDIRNRLKAFLADSLPPTDQQDYPSMLSNPNSDNNGLAFDAPDPLEAHRRATIARMSQNQGEKL